MKRIPSSVLAAFAVAALAACQTAGVGPLTPNAFQTNIAPQAGSKTMQQTLGQLLISRTKLPVCAAPVGKIPGTYTTFVAGGKEHAGDFKGITTATYWVTENLTPATPAPSPSGSSSPAPTTSPTTGPTPPPKPAYFYYGTFSFKKGAGGCVYLIVSKKGTLAGSKFNGEAIGFPHLKSSDYNATPVAYGTLSISITGLSASGGRGTFTLDTTTGKKYKTGSIKLDGRILVP